MDINNNDQDNQLDTVQINAVMPESNTSDPRHHALCTYIQQMGTRTEQPLPLKTLQKFFPFLSQNLPTVDKLLEKFQTEFFWHHKDGQKLRWSKSDQQIFFWTTIKVIEEEQPISSTIIQLSPISEQKWQKISHLLGVDTICLQKQWLALQKKSVRTERWSAQEDGILRQQFEILSKNGTVAWKDIASEIFARLKIFRTSRQVRARWFNFVDPGIVKDYWSSQEDKVLLQSIVKHGKKWSVIADSLSGRNYNQVKNRFNSLVKKFITKKNPTEAGKVRMPDKELAQRVLELYCKQMKVVEEDNPLSFMFRRHLTQAATVDNDLHATVDAFGSSRSYSKDDDHSMDLEELQKQQTSVQDVMDKFCIQRSQDEFTSNINRLSQSSKKINKSSQRSNKRTQVKTLSIGCNCQTPQVHSHCELFDQQNQLSTTIVLNQRYTILPSNAYKISTVYAKCRYHVNSEKSQ